MGGTMNNRTVKRLTDLEIDEVSVVDRPANQYGLVAFAKRAEETGMTIYDAAGDEVFEDELQHGDVVYDDDGTEYVFVEDGDDTTAELQSGYDYEQEPELVGKATLDPRKLYSNLKFGMANAEGETTSRSVKAGQELQRRRTQASDAWANTSRRRKRAVVGTTAVAGGAGVYGMARKSLGESVYEELSKALTSDDQAQVISKAMDRVSKAEEAAAKAWSVAEALQDERDLAEFTEIAKSYNLPVAPERLGRILKSAAATLPDEDLAELDRLLTAQGELFQEYGSDLGGQDSEILGQIQALALETVGKADVSVEQATVALFEANPAAYDEYLSEQGR